MYADELEPLLALEQELRLKIGLRIAEEENAPAGAAPSGDHLAAADAAIEAWRAEGEDDQDMRAFRPIGPLQQLLTDHALICDRIVDIRDRRLS
jgi:hypothetical protein